MHELATGNIGDLDFDLNNSDVRCPYCNDLLTNIQVRRKIKYCCRSHQISARNKKCWTDESYRENLINQMIDRMSKDEYKNISIENISKFNNSTEDEYADSKARLSEIRSSNLKKLWQDQDYRDYRTRVLQEQAIRLAEENKGIHSYESFCNRAYNQATNYDKLYYYIARFTDESLMNYFKLGVTSDADKRNSFNCHHEIDNLQVIAIGSGLDIAELELFIKLTYAEKNWSITGSTESFLKSEMDIILDTINSYIESSTTIEKLIT